MAAAAFLAIAGAVYLLGDPGYQPPDRGYLTLSGTAIALCCVPLLSRRYRRGLSAAAALVLLVWSVAASYFGGLVWLPAVGALVVAALLRRRNAD